MVQIIPRTKSTSERFFDALGMASEGAVKGLISQHENRQRQEAFKEMGLDPRISNLPPEAQAAYFKQQFAPEKAETPLQKTQRELNEEKLRALQGRQNIFKQFFPEAEDSGIEPKNAPSIQNEMPELNTEQKSALERMSDRQLRQAAAFKNEPGEEGIIGNLAQEELERREKKENISAKREENLRKETLPIRNEISERAQLARQGIENKERALDILKKGNVDDPTYAIFAELLPFNLGKRLLSNDTVEYKSGLVDEFGDLRKIFQGQTRVKEIELLEDKIADLYLTDDQKKAILNSRINVLKADLIREEAAAELESEGKFYGALQFRREVEKQAKPKLEALFNKVLDEQKAIIKDAENQKKIPLDINDPDGKKIIEEIFIEAWID